jgi:DNA invertase Pin-like site-specific DNA recombinase
MIYGYARVSTDGQSVDAHVKALHAVGAEKVIRETASGTKSDRAGLRRVLDGLDAGDVLMVTRLDQLAVNPRSSQHHGIHCRPESGFPVTWRRMGRRDDLARTADVDRAGLAEFERELIRARTGEGRERARAQGVKMGRKPKLTAHQIRDAIKRRDSDGETVRDMPGPSMSATARFHG